jgi:hypothetical protein
MGEPGSFSLGLSTICQHVRHYQLHQSLGETERRQRYHLIKDLFSPSPVCSSLVKVCRLVFRVELTMSIRRKSCDTCFAGRRKCDLTFPICDRCSKAGKECHYKYPPQLDVSELSRKKAVHRAALNDAWGRAENQVVVQTPLPGYRRANIPRMTGDLGEPRPLTAKVDYEWVAGQIFDVPFRFARQADAIFLHRDLYQGAFPQPLRSAFGLCAGTASMTQQNRHLLFQALEDETSLLLRSAWAGSLFEDLAKLQAIVLFQVIRLYHGDHRQQMSALRQEFVVRSRALSLLHRVREGNELSGAPKTWETWLLMESIRRTVLFSFKLYLAYWCVITYEGSCSEIEEDGINSLPISMKQGSWESRQAFARYSIEDDELPYRDFTSYWLAVPRSNLETFERFIILGCTGQKKFEAVTKAKSSIAC